MPKRLTTLDRPTDRALDSHSALIDTLLVLTGLTIEEAIRPKLITGQLHHPEPARHHDRQTDRPTPVFYGDPQDVCRCYLDTAYNCERYGCAGVPGEREYVTALLAGEYDDLAEAQAEREDLLIRCGIGPDYLED